MIITKNSNRANNVIKMGVNDKVGIFFSKQQRTKELQQQNIQLQQKLNNALQRFHQQNEHLQRLKTKNKTTQTLVTVLNVENQLLDRQNQQIQQSLNLLQEEKQRFIQNEKYLTTVMIDVQRQLFQNTKKHEQQANLLQRYQEEIKNQKTIRIAPDSILNVVAKLQKDLQLLKRNIAIHESKLQGKKKYLNLLQKKQHTQTVKQEKIKKQLNPPKTSLNIFEKNYSLTSFNPINTKRKEPNTKDLKRQNQVNQINLKSTQEKNQEFKKLNQMIRKKNSLMAQNNSKKKI